MSVSRLPILMVRRVAWTIGRDELKEYFSQFGRVRNVSIPYNKSIGLHRGYGFVTFDNRKSMESALSARHLLEGQVLQVNESVKSESKIADISESDED